MPALRAQQTRRRLAARSLLRRRAQAVAVSVLLLVRAAPMSATARILEHLQRVRQTAPDRWIAACPAHEDRSPSLSVRELDDGRVLLHDFGGCETGDILAALGLQLSDLYDRPLEHTRAPTRSRIPARDLLELVAYECDVAGILLMQIAANQSCSAVAWERLALAAQRVNAARLQIHVR